MGDRRHAGGEPFDLLQFHPVPRRVADHRIEAAGRRGAAPIGPHAGERRLPVKKATFGGKRAGLGDKGVGGRLDFGRLEALRPRRAAPPLRWLAARFARRDVHRVAIIAAEQHFAAEFGCVAGRRQPAGGVREIEKGAQCRGGFLHSGETLTAAFDLADIGVGQFLDPRHSRRRLAGLGHIGADHEPIAFVQFALDRADEFAEQRVAAAQMMVEKRQWRADRERVQPQRQFRQFDRHRVQIDAIDHPLQDDAADEVAIVELIVGHGPVILVGGAPDFRTQIFDPRHQWRAVGLGLIRPCDQGRRVADRGQHLVTR